MERFFLNTALKYSVAAPDAPEIGTLKGYATKFNVPSHDRGGYRDLFRPGVFGDSVMESNGFDVKALFDHDHDRYLARTRNETLRLDSDDIGLRFELDLPNTQLGRDTAELLKRGDIAGMSFGYMPDRFEWRDTDELPIREHQSGTLIEVSVVFQPAIPLTEVELSALTEPSDAVIESLAAWKQAQAGTPRRQRAERMLRILELTA